MSETPSVPQFDEYAETYRHHVAKALPPGVGEVDKFARIKAWYLARAIAGAFPGRDNVAILDAGCGIGLTDSYLKSEYENITGFDVSPNSIDLAARANPELSYHCNETGNLPFPDASFEVVFVICVVHHIPPERWAKFFGELHRVAKPGGLLLVYEHNPWNPVTRWIVSRCEFDRDAVLLSAPRCRRVALQCGFTSPRTRAILFFPFENAAWCRWERRLFSCLPLGAQYEFSARK